MEKNKPLSIKEAFRISRPSWWITTSAPFFAGYLYGKTELSFTLIIGTIYFAVFYNLFMYGVNDIYDYESDIKNPRKLETPGSVLAKSKHSSLWKWVLVTNIPFLLYFIFVGNVLSNVWLIFMVYMVLAYSVKGLRFKEVPFLDSFTSAFHYSSPLLFGLLLSETGYFWLPAFGAFFLWAMGNHAFGAVQDITPDKKGGIGSIAVSLGAKKTIYFTLASYTVAAAVPIYFYGMYGILPALLVLPYIVLVASTLSHANNNQDPIFRRSWKLFLKFSYICGFILSMYLMGLAFKSWA